MIQIKPLFQALLFSPLLLNLLFAFSSSEKEKIKIACVGDSITYGARLDDRDTHSYPAQLQQLLGKAYAVENFGVGSLTLLRKGIPSVWDVLPKIMAANPDIVIISLGTNDTCGFGTCGDRKCWEYKDEFESDYRDLINELAKLPSHPQIFLCAPTPMVLETPDLDAERIAGLHVRKPRLQELIATVKRLANEMTVHFIDLNKPLDHRPELFTITDGVHPNKEGYAAIAALVWEKITE
jgi:acyl-CoA thioesterase I